MPGATVFVSYARADRRLVAPLVAALETEGHTIWWDVMIEGGTAFAAAIEERLAAADAVIAVWSRASVASDWVRDEAGHARDRKRLVPITIDGTPPPLGFRQYHACDLSDWRGDTGDPTFQAVLRAIAHVANAETAPVPAPVRRRSIDRRAVIAAGGAGLAAVAGAGWWALQPARASGNSIAVLPFANLSGDAAQAYFSDGLSEELRAALAANAALKVAAPTSSNMFRGQTGDARGVAAKLGVAYLLEGSVRRAGQVVRVATNLIDASTGFTAWSESFDRTVSDIFAVQAEIATTVAKALAVRVAHVAAPGGTTDVAAYDAYLRGRALFDADDGEVSDRAALAQFDAAIRADPRYAAALAARSRSLAAIAAQYGAVDELGPMNDQAVAAARQAVALAPDSANTHLALGYALFSGKLDIASACVPFDRARALGGGDADVLVLFGLYCARVGRPDDARDAVTRARTLDPLNPRTYRALASVALAGRRYADVGAPATRALELAPKLANAHALIGTARLMLGDLAGARSAYAVEPTLLFQLSGLAIVERRAGNAAKAEAALARLRRERGDGSLYQQAQVLAQWGDRPAALVALERARAVGDGGLVYLATDPLLDPIRDEPRFRQLLRQLRFA